MRGWDGHIAPSAEKKSRSIRRRTSSTVCFRIRRDQIYRIDPIRLREDRTLQQQLEIDLKQGFNRVEVNGEMKRIDEYKPVAGDEVYLLVDRMAVANTKDAISRLTDSAETAMYEGTVRVCYVLSAGRHHQAI